MDYNYSKTIDCLLEWYDSSHRTLPWREQPLPYYVWISEIMLQQTRVEAVKAYFDRFIKELPTINDLAQVDDDKLMKLWEGLGYYNRARNLKKTAQILVTSYKGELPSDYKKLLELPGIGSYTAGAIASIAYGIAVPAVDGNVLRVMKRLAGSFDDITKDKVKKQLEDDLLEIVPEDRPGDYNQAIMELGAMVCIPNGKPLCNQCPVMHLCKAYKEDTHHLIPVKPKKKPRKLEAKTILIYEYKDTFAIRKREEKGLLPGLWELPNIDTRMSMVQVEDYVEELDVRTEKIIMLQPSKHIFSHIEWHMEAYYIKLKEIPKEMKEKYTWAYADEIKEKYSLPSAFDAYKKCIEEA